MLLPDAQARCSEEASAYFTEGTPAPLALGVDRAASSGCGEWEVSAPLGRRGSSCLGPCSSSFSFCLWPSDCWGQAGEQNLGRLSGEERSRVKWMGMDPDSSSGISTQTCQVGGQDRCPITCWGGEWECERRGVPRHPIKSLLFEESLLSEDRGLCSSLSPALSLSHGTMEIAQRGERAGLVV